MERGNDRRDECIREKSYMGAYYYSWTKTHCRVQMVSIFQMAQLIGIRSDLLLKGLLNLIELTILKLFSSGKIDFHLILPLATNFHWPLYQLDIENVFLHGKLKEEVYMDPPPGFVTRGQENKVCLLKESLYGLK